jgi:hypothetical protein
MAEHDHNFVADFAAKVQSAPNQRRADALALVCRHDRHRRQCEGRNPPGRGNDVQRAKEDVPHDRSLPQGHQRKPDVAACPQAIDQAGFVPLSKCQPVHLTNRLQIAWRLFSEINGRWHWKPRSLSFTETVQPAFAAEEERVASDGGGGVNGIVNSPDGLASNLRVF